MEVRKFVMIVEETCRESGKEVSPPHRKAASIAVAFTDSGRPLARLPGLTLEEFLQKG